MAVLNEYAKFSFHTLEKNRDVIMVVENQFQFSLPIDLQSVIKNVNYKSLLDLRILNEVGSHDCFVWDNAKLPFSIRYYDLTLALSHMDFGLKPEYAEQYIADIGNMLQMYFKYADLNSINFRLFATAYLSPGNKLSMVNFNYAKNYLEAGKNEVIVDDENLKFAEKFTDVWASEYPRFSFSVPNKPHPKVLLKPIVYSSVYGYAKAKLLELKSIDFPLNNFSTGVIFIQKHQVLDIYEHVLTMGHELGHLFGISHDHVYADCGNDLSAMTVGKVLGWAKFTPCNRKNIQWDKEFEHTTKNELSNFNFEALKQN
ncbi:hypothetical protein HMI55_005465 [Coelomomyces lativittatus]|nr:hypothetical protein HMI55_005465 [Coelomomyces lativittatus]